MWDSDSLLKKSTTTSTSLLKTQHEVIGSYPTNSSCVVNLNFSTGNLLLAACLHDVRWHAGRVKLESDRKYTIEFLDNFEYGFWTVYFCIYHTYIFVYYLLLILLYLIISNIIDVSGQHSIISIPMRFKSTKAGFSVENLVWLNNHENSKYESFHLRLSLN